MLERDPSFPSYVACGQSSSASSIREQKARALADLPLNVDREKEFRSKFRNERSTPK